MYSKIISYKKKRLLLLCHCATLEVVFNLPVLATWDCSMQAIGLCMDSDEVADQHISQRSNSTQIDSAFRGGTRSIICIGAENWAVVPACYRRRRGCVRHARAHLSQTGIPSRRSGDYLTMR